MELSVVIPSRNGLHILEKYLPAVLEEANGIGDIIVVDDCSDDRTSSIGPQKFPSVKFISRKGSPGFCHAVNRGMAEASGEFLLLLNNDVVPSKGSFHYLAAGLRESPGEYCAAVPVIRRPDGFDESVLSFRFSRGLAITAAGGSGVHYPSGACSLWRRSSWETLGGLDTRYAPIYWEDTDIGARIHSLGWKILRLPETKVLHDHALTMGRSLDSDALRERNRFIFMDIHFANPSSRLSTKLWMPMHIMKAALTGNRAFLKGYRDYLKWKRC